jgi:hypothetical protein
VDDRNFSIRAVDRAEERENNGMIAAQGDDAWVVLAVLRDRNERFASERIIAKRSMRLAVKQRLVSFLNLINRVRVVARQL